MSQKALRVLKNISSVEDSDNKNISDKITKFRKLSYNATNWVV